MRRLALALLTGVLALGDLRAGTVDVDFNPKADFKHYNTWAWIPGRDQGHRGVLSDATMRGRVEKAISVRLDADGLHPASPDEKPDLLVRYAGDIGDGKDITTSLGSVMSFADPEYATLHFTVRDATLMVDLVDATTKTLAWRLYVNQAISGPNDPADKFSRALDKGFAKYPPSPSEITRKARELEKKTAAK